MSDPIFVSLTVYCITKANLIHQLHQSSRKIFAVMFKHVGQPCKLDNEPNHRQEPFFLNRNILKSASQDLDSGIVL